MKKKYGIGFLVGILLLILTFILAYRVSYNHALNQKEAKINEQISAEVEICYYIKDTAGYVTVYEADGKTVYEYTSILVSELPEHLQKDLQSGIKVTSLGQVYGFLENYSS